MISTGDGPPSAIINYPDGPVTSPTAVVGFNGAGVAVTNVAMGVQPGYAFIRIDVPANGATVQVRILPDLVDGSVPGLQNIFAETLYDVELVREVEPGQFLLDTPFFARSIQDPYLASVDPTLRILELDFQANASTRDPHSTLSGKGAFYLVIYGQAFGEATFGYLSGRLAIEVSTDRAGPLGADPRATLWGSNWLQDYADGTPAPPNQPTGPGGTQPPPPSGGGSPAGTAGADRFEGGAGNETIDGKAGQDYLHGGDGNDSINGGSDFDDTHGNMGDDTVAGGLGDDWVVGGKGQDILNGDDGLDLVLGNIGNDTCDGGAGSDTIRGGQDNDVLRGGAGNDYVSGDRGSDTVTGGTGADMFHSFGDAGLDRVTDFNRAEGDIVRLDPGTQYTVAQSGADVVISMVGGGQMVLAGVSMTSLTSGWIVVG